jgi:hypothetical protein
VNVSSLGMKGFLVSVLLIGACGGGSKPPPGKPCLVNSECTSPLSCSYGACHVTCVEARDCPTGQDCVKAPKGNVCQLPSEAHCNYRSDCMSPLVCALDRTCRSQCKADIDCPTSTQKCVAPDMVCAEPAEIDSTTNLLKNAQSTPVPDAPPDAGAGDGVNTDSAPDTGGGGGGSNGKDSGVCNATLLPEGGCDYCPAGACAHGNCVSGNSDYTCQCDMGYTLNGKTCVVTDSCKSNNQCPPAYACQNTAPPGQACLGQYAAWPVSDSMATAPTQLPSYVNNGDGTVTDGVTRLVWQLAGPTPGNCTTGAADGGADAAVPSCTFADAKAYCAGLGLAGRKDWRVPSKIELESLLDYSRQSNPLIAAPFVTQPTNQFWTSSPAVSPSSPGYVWAVVFSSIRYGANAVDPVSGDSYSNSSNVPVGPPSVRCVSGTGIGPTTPAVHYTIHAGAIDAGAADAALPMDTVTDNWTGLTWQRGSGYEPAKLDAQTYCSALGAGFRLPTLKELLTLVNPIYGRPAIDAIVFPGTAPNIYYTATVDVVSGNCSGMEFDNGASISFGGCAPGVNGWFVRCVR